MARLCSILVICLFSGAAIAQYQQQILFPNESGQPLLGSLVRDYKPDTVLAYGPARDTMFALIDNKNDSLTCVYTGLRIYLNPNLDPTQDAFSKNINTEHTWPQSSGAANGFARSDMHHLYPTRVDVNADRGSFPFSDIDDNRTDVWYYLNQSLTSIPTTNIDLYSEKQDSRFEPREDHKGDVARSMFYFYTMYRSEVDAADPGFFAQQRETLCNWHYADPVDETEWKRSQEIAKYQDDKANPFVLDCTLPVRTYCSDISLECMLTSVDRPLPSIVETVQVKPNPFSDQIHLNYRLREPVSTYLRFYNGTGQLVASLDIGEQLPGEHEASWLPKTALANGPYFYQLIFITRNGQELLKNGIIIKTNE